MDQGKNLGTCAKTEPAQVGQRSFVVILSLARTFVHAPCFQTPRQIENRNCGMQSSSQSRATLARLVQELTEGVCKSSKCWCWVLEGRALVTTALSLGTRRPDFASGLEGSPQGLRTTRMPAHVASQKPAVPA